MIGKLVAGAALLLLCSMALPACARTAPASTSVPASGPGIVSVAPSTGEREADRASILAALERVRPGGTVRFAAGTYLVGPMIRVNTPHVTLVGHPDGTTLRGCDPEGFLDPNSRDVCNGLELAGERQTVRGLTFEHAFWALHLGCCFDERATQILPDGTSDEGPVIRRTRGGHLVEGNTFRSAGTAVRVNGDWQDPAVVRGNRFLDNWHAVSINGHTVHLLDNHISAPEPEKVPYYGFAWDAIKISPPFGLQRASGPPACIGNIVEGNTIEGYVDGIRMETYLPGSVCRQNVIRGNTIRVRRATNPSREQFRSSDVSDSTVIGVPIALISEPPAFAGARDQPSSRVEDNLIEGNRIIGAEGIAIEIMEASRNRIASNTISRIVRREPFPGNTMVTSAQLPREANGSGIWVSAGSEENEIIGNTFEDIASHAVVLEGDRNRVETRSASDAVHDRGRGNRVVTSTAPTAVDEEIEALTARFVRALNDDSWRFLAPLYAPDAVLALPGGGVLEGREAILDYFRPIAPRIRGVEVTSSDFMSDERTVTVATTYTARFAPAAEPTPAAFSNTWARQADGSWAIVAGSFDLPGDPEVDSHGATRSGFFHSDGVRLHYLDFGGEGVPVLFISSGDRTAWAFMEFAPRFADQNRVLALSQRGAGPSQGVPAPVVAPAVLGRDIVALLDSLGIERAVIAHMWQEVLVYLAEEHPERLAGIVFLGGGVPEADWRGEDPVGLFRMLERSRAAIWGADPDASHAWGYAPRYLVTGGSIDVPALLFVPEMRTAEDEWAQILDYARLAGQVQARAFFPDSLAAAYFQRLAADEEMQERGRFFWRDTVEPAQRAAEAAFHRAFGDALRTVPVEARAIGYGYRDAPDLIYPHIRQFLRDVHLTPGADD
jgi:uncharacterized protein (TIGR02246 family)